MKERDLVTELIDKTVDFSTIYPRLKAGFIIVSHNIAQEVEDSLKEVLLRELDLRETQAMLDQQYLFNGLHIVVDLDSVDRIDIQPQGSMRTLSYLRR